MIATIFLELLNISITAGWIVLAVMLLRLCLKKTPKWISCVLWGIVALRLLVPVHITSSLSLIPSAAVIPRDITTAATPAIHSGIRAVNSTVNPVLAAHMDTAGGVLQMVLHYASIVWIAGMGLMMLYSCLSSSLLRQQVRASLKLEGNVYACDEVASPFVLGVFRPRIYVPSGLTPEQLEYVLAHENAHIKRRDHWWKPLGFLLLSVYWFNPLMWVAYTLLSRDIEQACDEKVIASMSNARKKGYSQALAACSMQRRMILVCPVAFGEVSVKTRIKGILNYKKPAFWVILASVAVCTAVAVCFLTDPMPCAHSFESRVLRASTCDREGQQYHTCNKCGYSYTEKMALLPHSFGEGTVTRQATCDREGQICAQCTVCNQTCVVERIAKTNAHSLVETVVEPATCGKEGTGIRTCSCCGYTEKCTYPKQAHSFKFHYVYPGNCITSGYNQMVCDHCGAQEKEMLTLSQEHRYFKDPVTGDYCCLDCGKQHPKLGSSDTKKAIVLPKIPPLPKLP